MDAGTNSLAPGDDIDGEMRPYNGTTDIGADEFYATRRSNVSDYSNPDDDDDGIYDTDEAGYGTDPFDWDSDDDVY